MPPQFLVVGHVVQDLISAEDRGAWRLGGAAAYASILACRMGLRTAVLTAASPGLPLADLLPGVECRVVPSPCTTRIRNIYEDSKRRQFVPQRAAAMAAGHLPDEWRGVPIVLLGPVAGEIDDSLASCFPDALVGIGAQGWLRRIGPDARVSPVRPARWHAEPLLGHAAALFFSDEDVLPEEAPFALKHWSEMVEIVAFTRGERGADVGHRGVWRHIDAYPVSAVDLTGAGDVFAAAFLVRYRETGDVWESARFASAAGALCVEGVGVEGVPDRSGVEALMAAHPAIMAR